MRLIVLTLFSFLLLTGCQQTDWVTLQTQGHAESSMVADTYFVNVRFRGKGSNQSQSSDQLTGFVTPFEVWAKEASLDVKAERFDIRPIYHYHGEQGRQLKGYEATQSLQVTQLSFDQYQQLMSKVPEFQPDEVSLVDVKASEEQKQQEQSRLTEQAFIKAREKALNMAKSAGLCNVSVVNMTEQMHTRPAPRMMQLEMASKSVSNTESQESVSVALDVQWRATGC